MNQKKDPAVATGEDQIANSVAQIMTVHDSDVKTWALEQLKHPAPLTWDEAIADKMLRLTSLSIGVKLQSWSPALLDAVRICEPRLLDALQTAQSRVDNAYREQDMRALGKSCGGWFAVCKAVWMVGGGER